MERLLHQEEADKNFCARPLDPSQTRPAHAAAGYQVCKSDK